MQAAVARVIAADRFFLTVKSQRSRPVHPGTRQALLRRGLVRECRFGTLILTRRGFLAAVDMGLLKRK